MIEVRQVTNMEQVMQVVPIEVTLKNNKIINTNAKDFLLFVQNFVLPNPLFRFWIATDDTNKVVGYSIAFMSPTKIFEMDYVSILRIWTCKRGVIERLESVLAEWCRENKITRQQLNMTKDIKAMKAVKRKFKFIPVSVNFERRI